MNAKEKKNALKSALSQRVKEGKLVLLNDLAVDEPKTKALAEKFARHRRRGEGASRRFAREREPACWPRATTPSCTLVDALHVNVYDVVNSRYIVLSQDALQRLTEALES